MCVERCECIAPPLMAWYLLRDIGGITIVVAILLNDGDDITIDSMFPFSLLSLHQSMITLRGMGVSVRVVSLERA